VWYWQKNRQEDQWIRIEDPYINPYSQLIFDKGAQNAWGRKDSLFRKCCWEDWKTETRSLFSTLYQNQLKWIKDLNIRPETLKELQEVVGNTLEQIGIRNDFLSRAQKAQHLRERMNKWDFIKLKSFYTAKETVTRLKRQSTECMSFLIEHKYTPIVSKSYTFVDIVGLSHINKVIKCAPA
jgi:hypothetical protein